MRGWGIHSTWTGAVSPHYLVPGNWIDDTTGDDPALRAPNVSDTVDISSAGLIDGDGGSAATLDLSGTNTLDGVLSVTVASIFGTLMLNGTLSATSGMSLSATGILDASGSLVGPLDDEGTITAAGTLTIGGPVSGTGFLDVAAGADLTLGSTIASGLNIGFAGSGGTLTLAAPGSVLAPVLGFGQGDAIVLDGIGSATSVRFAGETLALLDASGSLVASLALGLPLVNVPYASSNFQIATTGGNATITFQTPSVVDANAANAMQAGTARSTYGVSGAGITIGIISDGFDSAGEAQDIAAGNLPAASQINILNAGTGVEGRSMAEMIYQIAPGATIDFAAAGADENSFAQAVQQLRAAGATIIVDDILFPDQPFFQLGGTAQNAVQGAIAAGIDYFTSAGNSGDEYYENQFAPITSSLPGMGVQTAMDFGGGNALQQLVVPRGSSITLELQWAQPFASVGGGAGASGSLALVLYDALGNIVTTASVDDIGSDPMQQLNYTNTSASNVLQLAIVQTAGTVAPGTLLKYVVVSGSVIIEDPNAGTGSGSLYGQQLVPDANVVGATAYSETPAFGVATPVPEPFSSVGPGETFTYGAQGNITSTQSAGQISFTAAVGSWTAALGHAFVGTSAAAPEAAAVAALMLQANPLLTTMDVTNLLKDSALTMSGGIADAQSGAGLVQADRAVGYAQSGTITASANGNTRLYGTHLGNVFVGGPTQETFVLAGGTNVIKAFGAAALAGDTIENLAIGDQITLDVFANTATIDGTALEVFDAGTQVALFNIPGLPPYAQPVVLPGGGESSLVTIACFVGGTRILTPDGEIAIERIQPGDHVLSCESGNNVAAPVRWIGKTPLDIGRHARPERVAPIRIRTSAFSRGVPNRDLLVSPDHAVLFGDVLIPAGLLVNDVSILRERARGVVVYYHVECDRHTLLTANGLIAESYLDTGNRASFANAGVPQLLHPDFAALRWEADACRDLIVTGPKLAAARATLAARARRTDRPNTFVSGIAYSSKTLLSERCRA